MRTFPIDQMAYSIPDSFLTLRWMSHERFGAELGEQPDGLYLRIVHSLGQPLCFRLAPHLLVLEDGAFGDVRFGDHVFRYGLLPVDEVP